MVHSKIRFCLLQDGCKFMVPKPKSTSQVTTPLDSSGGLSNKPAQWHTILHVLASGLLLYYH